MDQKVELPERDRCYEAFGSTTFKQEETAGVEPDACFYIKNYQRMINRRGLQADDDDSSIDEIDMIRGV